MKFVELKKFLQTKTLNNYLLLGNDSFLLDRAFSLIKESQNFEPEELNVINFIESADGKKIAEALNTLPIMSEYKLTYLDVSSSDSKIENLQDLENYLKKYNPSSIFVIKAGENKKIVEKLTKYFEVVDCNKLSEAFVNSYIINDLKKHNKTISNKALKKLGEYTLYDLQLISGEIYKLVSYAFDENEITEKHVEEIVTKNLEYQVFDLTENLVKKNSERVFEILQDIKHKKDNEKLLLPLISNHFRRLFQVSLSNSTVQETASWLKVRDYAVTIATRQSKLFRQTDLKQINELCLKLDYEMKTGEIAFNSALDYLILKILSI